MGLSFRRVDRGVGSPFLYGWRFFDASKLFVAAPAIIVLELGLFCETAVRNRNLLPSGNGTYGNGNGNGSATSSSGAAHFWGAVLRRFYLVYL